MNRSRATLLCLIAVSATALYAAENWRQFRRDWYRTAATSEELRNAPPYGDINAFTHVWTREFQEWPHANANIAFADGMGYSCLMDGWVYAFDAGSTAAVYQQRWSFNTGNSIPHTACVYDGRVLVVNIRGRVVALDASSGTLRWEYTVPTNVFSSPLYVNGRLYFGGINGVVYCFDAENGGGPVWTFKTPLGSIDTAPAYHRGKILLASENMRAYALDWKTGAVVWDVPIAGEKTWNGSPVVARDADRVVFRTLSNYNQHSCGTCGGSTYREVCGACAGRYDVGYSGDADWPCLSESDVFFSPRRNWVNTNVVLNTETGAEIRSFSYNGQPVSLLPFTSMYWNAIPWCVWNHRILYAESFRRGWTVDLMTGEIRRCHEGTGPYGYYARGDENVLSIISGNRVIGGIRINICGLDLATGARYQFQGAYGGEGLDQTHIKARTFTGPHFQTFPGDGYTGTNSEVMVYRGRVYYVDNGWLLCMTPRYGSVADINTDHTTPTAPTGLAGADSGDGVVSLTWNASTDNVRVTSYRVYRNNRQIATCADREYIDFGLAANTQYTYRVSALDWPENESALSEPFLITLGSAPPVNQPPLVSLTSPVNNSTYTSPANITHAATASDPDGSVTRVEFWTGTTLLNADTSSPYAYSWTGVAAGSYALRAIAYDNQNATSTSTLVNITVYSSGTPANQPPVVSIAAPSPGTRYSAPANIAVSATADDSDGSVVSVGFYCTTTMGPNPGLVFLGSATAAPYQYTWANVGAGEYGIIARAKDDLDAVTSASVYVIVDPAAQPVLQPGEVRVSGGPGGYVDANVNPNVVIRFRRARAGKVTVKIYDLRGRLVHEKVKDGIAGIDDDIVWNAADLPAGVYLVRVKGGGVESSKRVVLVR